MNYEAMSARISPRLRRRLPIGLFESKSGTCLVVCTSYLRTGKLAAYVLATTLMLLHTPAGLRAQQASHTHAAELIDGSVEPQRIPDSTAYRLYLSVVAEPPDATPEQKRRQLAHLNRIGLMQDDLKTLIKALETFKTHYTTLIAQQHKSAEAATAAGRTDIDALIEPFLTQRDALVQATRDELQRSLTEEARARLHAHIQNEKKQMKVAAKEERR